MLGPNECTFPAEPLIFQCVTRALGPWEAGYGFAATRSGGNTDLGLSDLVAPLVYVHLLQQGSDDLPAGMGVLGQ